LKFGNIKHPTLNIERRIQTAADDSMFDVGCPAFNATFIEFA